MPKVYLVQTVQEQWEQHEARLKVAFTPTQLNIARQSFYTAWLDALATVGELEAMPLQVKELFLTQLTAEARELGRSEIGKMQN